MEWLLTASFQFSYAKIARTNATLPGKTRTALTHRHAHPGVFGLP